MARARNSKTAIGVAALPKKPKPNLYFNSTKPANKTQPGSALTAFLRRYRRDLLDLTSDRHISQLLSCVDCLLDEAERHGVTHGR